MALDHDASPARDAFTYEVSCVVLAATEEEAFAKLHSILANVDHYWVEEGEPLDDDERERYLGHQGNAGQTSTSPNDRPNQAGHGNSTQ